MFVRIANSNQKIKIIVGNIYRVPKNQHVPLKVFLAGGFNIDLLKIHDEKRYADFLDTIISHSFFPQIALPTRIGTTSSSLIDIIFSKVSPSVLNSKSGIIVTALSDHFPTFITS